MPFEGKTYQYKDPSLSGYGIDGSVWGMVGDGLIQKRKFGKVIFANSGLGGRKIEDLREGKHFDFLVAINKGLVEKYGKIDAILFLQGESETDSENTENYYSNFFGNLKIIRILNSNLPFRNKLLL